MKTIKLFYALTLVLFLASCSSDDDATIIQPVTTGAVENLDAANVDGFLKFSFSEGAAVTGDDWDIALDAGGTILVNGGDIVSEDTETDPNNPTGGAAEPQRTGEGAGYIIEGSFESITEVNTGLLVQDATDVYAVPSDMLDPTSGWMVYDMTTHLINPIANRVIVIKTHDGKYAKMQISSVYENEDTSNAFGFGFYHFTYSYNPNQGMLNLVEPVEE